MSQKSTTSLSAALHKLLHYAPTITGIAVTAALGILYFRTRTVVHTFDAVSYMWNIEVKPLGELFHPHHLLYAPLGQLAYRLAQSLGYDGYSDAPIQAVNALAGALGILFLWRFGVRWTKRPWASLGVAATVGVCYAYWLYASEVEVYTLAAAFLTLSMWILAALDEQPHPARAAALGVAHAGAIMFHQTNILFAVPVVLFLLLRPALRSLSILAAYAGAGTLAVGIPYGLVIGSSGLNSPNAVYRWLTDYAQTGRWGGYLSLEHLPALQSGLAGTISGERWLVWAFYSMAVLGMILIARRSLRSPHQANWLAFGGAWLVLYSAFFWWWEPFNIEFWIALLPLWGFWIMAGWPGAVSTVGQEDAAPEKALSIAKAVYTIAPIILAISLFRANLAPVQAAGDPNNDYYYLVTAALQPELAPDDVVVTRGNILDVYIPFYARHAGYLSLRELEYNAGGDRAQVMSNLTSRLDEALALGKTIWIDQMVVDEARSADRNPFGLPAEEIDTLKARYGIQPDVDLNGSNVFYSTPHRQQSGASAWSFDGSLSGWRAWGVGSPRFEQGAWCFTGGHDPQLQSPPLAIDAGRWAALEMELTLGADRSTVQVFWRAQGGDYSLEQSIRIETVRGQHTYLAQLAGAPGWDGTIVQLRIDPAPGISGTDGNLVTACLRHVRLLDRDE